MIVKSVRLGPLDVPEKKIVNMEKPILGFENLRRFCLIELDEIKPFLWFQSADDPAVAFMIVNPIMFFRDYRIEINSKEIAELNISDVSSVETYAIVTIPDNPEDISINLQGPILINTENRRAKQLVLVNSHYQVRHKLWDNVTDSVEVYSKKAVETVEV